MVALAVEVTMGVAFRYTGNALVWYDEVASILLAWVTYYGAALAALKRAHIGVPELVHMLPPAPRVAVAVFAEVCVLAYDNLVSLPGVSVAWAQSVIPISAVLFIIAEALTLPKVIREARRA